mmetsp:Transcript_16620/g.33660  ORF Transcript_16620/g.33660 Transcript_16620/m.33660 type:complete len:328 (-) Transcript_16620:1434-2417(-)|eukprot:CAMPEP_0171335672 /NCGR_PEP_ID=MMETSP0878-20121228/5507_1 /TAXON_ID=67004 /ORGANISM="Thalassiosira weissflogii, Strain CCMP1336" /LENGTH=327 /DNA_ID=CAMNT_0011836987 /DNA_START=19 /DNA_END=1002 /DNA_ORIENTATION=-
MIRISTNSRLASTATLLTRKIFQRNTSLASSPALHCLSSNGRRGAVASLSSNSGSSSSNSNGGSSSSSSTSNPPPPGGSSDASAATAAASVKYAKTTAGTGNPEGLGAAEEGVVTRGPVTWPALGLVAVVAASAVAYYKIERERRLENAMGKIVSTGKPAIGGPWSLVDLDGNLVTNKSFEGKWTLLYFGFARCPDICPSEMVKVGKVMDRLEKEYPELRKKVQPIFVSIDPARDSLKALRDYSKDFHPSYVFLTGAPEQVQAMAKKYRVYMSKADETEDGDYLVDHSIVIYFHDDTGDISDCFTQSMRPSDVVEKIVERMTFVPKY